MNVRACFNGPVVNGGIIWAYNERSISNPTTLANTNCTTYNISINVLHTSVISTTGL